MERVEDEKLVALAAPVAGRGKAPPELVRGTILKLCRGRFLTREAMAKLLDRNTDSLRRRYLGPMVREGMLRLRHPEAPNRPDQAYTTVVEP